MYFAIEELQECGYVVVALTKDRLRAVKILLQMRREKFRGYVRMTRPREEVVRYYLAVGNKLW